MSVDRTDYIVYGWKLPYKLKNDKGEINFWEDDKFEPYIEGHKGIEYTLVIDGMGGQYNVFGKLIAYATDDGDAWGFEKINLTNLQPTEVKEKFKELFEVEANSDPYLFIFSHYH